MNEKLKNYMNAIFAPYEGVKSVTELKADLLSDLEDRFKELKADGNDDETAFAKTIDSIGDIEQTVQEVANLSRTLERQVLINFSASNLPKSDFADVKAHKGKFDASMLRGSDFSGADLTGSSFKASDVRESSFDRADLTECKFISSDLKETNFNKTIFVRTEFNTSDLTKAKFTNAKLIDVKLSMTDLRKTIFENCIFNGVEFKYSDLRELCFDGQTFIDVHFKMSSLIGASFKGAILKNVSFIASETWTSWSKKYFRNVKTINFDGATMDKLTYAALKGMDVDLSKVTVI